MLFNFKKTYKVNVVFDAPLLGYDVIKVYTPQLEEWVNECMMELISSNLDKIEIQHPSRNFKCIIETSHSLLKKE
jgi:hypothetical protein